MKNRFQALFICILVIAALAFAPVYQDIPERPVIRLNVGNQTAGEEIYSYCWPVAQKNNRCDFKAEIAFASPLQIEDGQQVTVLVEGAQPPSRLLLSRIVDDEPLATQELPNPAQAIFDANFGVGTHIVQLDALYDNVAGVQAYVSYRFSIEILPPGSIEVAQGSPTVSTPATGITQTGSPTVSGETITATVTEVTAVFTPTLDATITPTKQPPSITPTRIQPTATSEETEEVAVIVETEESTVEIVETEEAVETAEPTEEATVEMVGTAEVTSEPTEEPAEAVAETVEPTEEATIEVVETEEVTAEPTEEVTEEPTSTPTKRSTATPTMTPTRTQQPTQTFTSTFAAVATEGITATATTVSLAEETAEATEAVETVTGATSTTVPLVQETQTATEAVAAQPAETATLEVIQPTATTDVVQPTATSPVAQPNEPPAVHLVFAGQIYQPAGVNFCQTSESGELICLSRPLQAEGATVDLLQNFAIQVRLPADSPRPQQIRFDFLDPTTLQPLQSDVRRGDRLVLFNIDVGAGTYFLRVSIDWGTTQAEYFFRVRVS